MRVTADRELCVGSGACEMLAPDVFEVSDDGVVHVLQDRPDDEESVRQAAQQCPTRALTVTD
ncbi:ferredoxin [Geodermatophilus aquaeductus]|jgi:ferredoxin|uniref:Ferredoxin n=1 Tax=Geodermatophilus aquaeductus TaxID=1564161 RepID=A0A521EMR3_9ACTN|nr:ferredoxin [Geodermatophilus aquaeductus]SMO85208.1 ferredoxin [Geodermatophilus aquaeductus]